MRAIIALLGILYFSTGLLAQAPPVISSATLGSPIETSDAPATREPILTGADDCHRQGHCCPDTRFWASAEYLYWRVSAAPIRVPLVTRNNDPTSIGALNEPGTTVLFGAGSGSNPGFGWFSGGRVTVGGWLDGEHCIGIEGSGFLLENRTSVFSAASAGAVFGGPVLSIPFTATQPFGFNPAGPSALSSGGGPNTISATLTSRLWGAEANGVVNLFSNDRLRIMGLAGFRYLDLLENLTLTDSFFDPASGQSVVSTDGFGTRNQFYSGQIGARAGLSFGRFTLDTTSKIAFGVNHQSLNIFGQTAVPTGAFAGGGLPVGNTPGGLFAERTNIGHFERNVFAVVPEVQAKLGFAVTQRVQSFVGYNFLYLNNALRPGNQIDNNINPTQNPLLTPPPAILRGPAAPLPQFQNSSFWAQGITFGMEFQF